MTTPATVRRSMFGVSGMDCADCAVTLEKRLTETPGVASCAVRFHTGTADVTFDPAVVSEGLISNRIRELGYGVNRHRQSRVFMISGMDCADCAETLQSSISALPGVVRADVSFGTGQMRVYTEPDAVTDAQIRSAVERLGYRATALDVTTNDARDR
ncbi:MAG: cation transporter, partial [Chloroflexota bacterium]|nr:cation transporter [Chloroflexota bacterium]